MDSFTKVINGQVYFAGDDDYSHGGKLVTYCNKICQEECGITCDIENPPDCDCVVSRLYYAMTKLAEWEHKGLTFEQYRKFTKTRQGEVERN